MHSFRSLNVACHYFFLSLICRLNLHSSDFVFPLIKYECTSQIVVVLCADSRETSVEQSGKNEQLRHTFTLKFISVYELLEENLTVRK